MPLVRYLKAIRATLELRRTAIVTAEALVWHHGADGVERARAAAALATGEEERILTLMIARIAYKRHRLIRGLDVATQYYVADCWARRRGQMIR